MATGLGITTTSDGGASCTPAAACVARLLVSLIVLLLLLRGNGLRIVAVGRLALDPAAAWL